MPVFIALLRGINVGKAKRVPMADLRVLLAGLGLGNVKTLLNSGNAVFTAAAETGGDAAAHAQAIRTAIATHLGVDVPVIVKTAAQLAAAVAENPYAATADNPSQLVLAFTQSHADLQALQAIAAWVQPPEAFSIGEQAAYLHCAQGILESKAGEALMGSKAGKAATCRNWATTQKLHALAASVDPSSETARPAASPSQKRP